MSETPMPRTALVEQPRPGTSAWQRVTYFDALFALLALLAGIMRLSSLGSLPLSPAEAQQALAVWSFWQPNAGEAVAALGNVTLSPAYFSLTSLLMLVLGNGDAVMRLAPALAGVGLVLLPWLLRGRLGRPGALVAALLLAVSPTFSLISRTAGGDALALFAGLVLIIAWLRYWDGDGMRWVYTGALALGFGLATSALFYTLSVTWAVAWFVQWRLGPSLPGPAGARVTTAERRRAGLVAVATFLAVSTLFFWNLAGLGAAAGLLGAWFSSFSFAGGLAALLQPILLLIRYEPALLLLGIPALAWATWRGGAFPSLLAYGFSVALLLALLQNAALATVAVVALFGYLLVARWAGTIFEQVADPLAEETLPVPMAVVRWGLFLILLACAAVIYFNLGRHLRVTVFDPQQIGHLLIALLGLFVAVALVNFVRVWDRAVASQSALLALLVVFTIFGWGTAWWLTHTAATDPRTRWFAETSDNDVLLLAENLREISLQTGNSATGIELISSVDTPVLRWYLRDMHRATFGAMIPPEAQPEAIITPAAGEPNQQTDYFGADFAVARRPAQLPENSSVSDVLRWWLFRQSAAATEDERVILWIRTELAQGSPR